MADGLPVDYLNHREVYKVDFAPFNNVAVYDKSSGMYVGPFKTACIAVGHVDVRSSLGVILPAEISHEPHISVDGKWQKNVPLFEFLCSMKERASGW